MPKVSYYAQDECNNSTLRELLLSSKRISPINESDFVSIFQVRPFKDWNLVSFLKALMFSDAICRDEEHREECHIRHRYESGHCSLIILLPASKSIWRHLHSISNLKFQTDQLSTFFSDSTLIWWAFCCLGILHLCGPSIKYCAWSYTVSDTEHLSWWGGLQCSTVRWTKQFAVHVLWEKGKLSFWLELKPRRGMERSSGRQRKQWEKREKF